MTAIDPELCNCGVPIADTSLAHYLTCSGDVPSEEAEEIQQILGSWAARELRDMEEGP